MTPGVLQIYHYFFYFLPLYSFIGRTDSEMTGKEGGLTHSKGPQVGLKPRAAAAKTKPQYMGRLLYQLS